MFCSKKHLVTAAVLAMGAVTVASAQTAPSRATNVRVISAEGYDLGRGDKASSMFVLHRVDYCLGGGSRSDFGNLKVSFDSKRVNEAAAQASRGKGLVRGELSTIQEPLDGKNRRCGSFSFDVHADTLLSALPFAKESDPKIIVSTPDGRTVATFPVSAGLNSNKK